MKIVLDVTPVEGVTDPLVVADALLDFLCASTALDAVVDSFDGAEPARYDA
jgi:hypothetical protein